MTVTGGVLSTMNPSEELSVDKPTSRVSMVGDKWFMLSCLLRPRLFIWAYCKITLLHRITSICVISNISYDTLTAKMCFMESSAVVFCTLLFHEDTVTQKVLYQCYWRNMATIRWQCSPDSVQMWLFIEGSGSGTSHSRLREPGFESCAAVLNLGLVFFHSTLLQFTQMYE